MQLTIDLIQGTQLARAPRPDAALMAELNAGAPLALEALWLVEDGEHPVFTVRFEGGDLLRVEGLERLGAFQGDRLVLWTSARHPDQESWWGTASLLLADAQVVHAMAQRAPAVLQERLVQHLNLSLDDRPRALTLAALKDLRARWRALRGAVEGELVRFEQSVMRPLRSLGRMEQRLGVPVRLSLGPPPEGPPPGSGGGPSLQDPDPDDRFSVEEREQYLVEPNSAPRRPVDLRGETSGRAGQREAMTWREALSLDRGDAMERSLSVRRSRPRLTDSEPELQRLLEHLERALGREGTLTPVALLSPPKNDGDRR